MMKKREFLKKGLVGAVGLYTVPSIVKANNKLRRSVYSPVIFNNFNGISELAPSDALRRHYNRSYVEGGFKLNNMIQSVDIHLPLRKMFHNANSYNKKTLELAGDYYNHRLFWKTLSPSRSEQLSAELENRINIDFGSLNGLKKDLCQKAENANNQSWIWVVFKDESLKIVTTENNTNPYFNTIRSEQKGIPLIGVDLFSHSHESFSSKYDYCQTYFDLINWRFVSKRYKKILNGKL